MARSQLWLAGAVLVLAGCNDVVGPRALSPIASSATINLPAGADTLQVGETVQLSTSLATNRLCVTPTGTGVTLQSCTGESVQRWVPAPPTARFTAPLMNAATGQCLATQNGATAAATPAALAACSGATGQVLSLPPEGIAGPVLFFGGTTCFDNLYVSGKVGDVVGVYPCHGGPNQSWTRTRAGQVTMNGLCVTPTGSNVTLQTCTGAAGQRWTAVSPTARFNAPLVSAATGQCLATQNGGTAPATPAAMATCSGATGQLLSLPPTGAAGTVLFFSGTTCFDNLYVTGKVGDVVGIYPCHGGANQSWVRTAADEVTPASTGSGSTTTWTSSNSGVATVTQSGVVTAVGLGSAVIAASNGSSTSSTTIVVSPLAPSVGTRVSAPLVNGAAGQCLATQNGSTGAATPAALAACTGATSQVLSLPPVGTAGPILFFSGTTCLDDLQVHGRVGDVIGIYPCHGGANQNFTRTPAGEVTLNALCLTPTGTGITLQSCTGAAGQRWAPSSSPTTPAPIADVVPAPELPRAYVNTSPVTPTGITRSVRAGDDLQQVINAAAPGDVIALQSGATFTGNFELPAKNGDAWITITAAVGTPLPAAGTRITPAHAPGLPKLVTPNAGSALATRPGAHRYRIVGIEVAAAPSVSTVYSLVSLGTAGSEQSTLAQVPYDIVLDRVYVHGSATLDVRRCVALNSANSAVIDSHLSDCHSRTNDSQAIIGWNGPGPFKIVNNYLEGAGENVMFGGGDPSIRDLVPSDIELRRNHFYKPLAWQSAGWIVKNLFELKNARRVLAEGNVLEHSWAGGQSGAALVWKSVNEGGTAPWSTTSDVTFRYNVVRGVGMGLNISGQPEAAPVVRAARFRIAHNVFERVGDPSLPSDWRVGRLWQIDQTIAVDIAHNTGVGSTNGLFLVGAPVSGGFSMRDNIFGGGAGIASAEGKGVGVSALDYHVPGWTVAGNVILGAATGSASFPGANLYATSASAAGLSSDLRVVAAPALGSATTDGQAPGADRAMVEQKTAGVVIR